MTFHTLYPLRKGLENRVVTLFNHGRVYGEHLRLPDVLCSSVRLGLCFWLQQMVSFHGNIHLLQEEVPKSESKLEGDQDRVYLDLTPVKSFLHCAGKKPCQPSSLSSPALERAGNKAAADSTAETAPVDKDAEPCKKEETSEQVFKVWFGARIRQRSGSPPHHPTSFPLSSASETPRKAGT